MEQNALDQLLGVVATPTRTLREVSEEKPVAIGVALIVLTSLSTLIVPSFSIFQETLPQLSGSGARMLSWFYGLVATGVLLLSVHVIAKAFTSSGTLPGFISAYGYARFPGLLEFPLLVLGTTALAPIASLASFGLAVWLFVLNVLAIRESYQLRTGASLLVLLISFVATAFVLAIVGVMMVLGLGGPLL